MKKCLLILMIIPMALFSQEIPDSLKTWNVGGLFSVNFSQVSLTNWVAGGRSSSTGLGIFNVFGNYKKDRILWENSLDMGYGIIKEKDMKSVKSDDRISLSSKLGLQQSEKLYYSLLFNFRTQFADGYKYPDTENVISRFMAPAYFTLALGMDYKPHKDLSIFFSPATARLTVVTDDDLSAQGAFGVDPGEKTRFEAGALLKFDVNTEIIENVTLNNKLEFFSNYLENPQNIDIRWDMLLNMKINDYLSANLITNLIYDDDIKVPLDEDDNGIIDSSGPRIQFKEMFGVGLNVKF
ncbi:MAG TPA: DUF3078 domain-containing protein [Prolixibacteraceae bacterium]|nr:DUF3078 domain-containing protein [Prolixibacteraceae bacterium]